MLNFEKDLSFNIYSLTNIIEKKIAKKLISFPVGATTETEPVRVGGELWGIRSRAEWRSVTRRHTGAVVTANDE